MVREQKLHSYSETEMEISLLKERIAELEL